MTDRRIALITGGTKGFGKAIGLKLAGHGNQVILTYGWGSVEEDDILREFADKGCVAPILKQADVSNDEDTAELIGEIGERFGRVDVFVSNVAFANLIKDVDEYREKDILKSIEYSTWPMVAYTQAIHSQLGRYPRYVLALSSHGPDRFHKNYDFAAATKALNEVLVKYLTYRFHDKQVIFNIIRTRPIITDSLLATLGEEWQPFIAKYDIPGTEVDLEEIGNLVLMMCSGMMDAIRGQTIIADKGYDFADGLQHMYINREDFGL
jgi:NAD(P)-dependent dehydrogenase (short-subunit alcohol dehydrogenase family)